MKRIKKLLSKVGLICLVLLASVTSCDKTFLEPTNINQLTPDTFWSSEEDAESALVGAYSPLSNVQSWGRMMNLHTEYRSDVVDPIPVQGVLTDASNFSINPTFPRLAEIWGEMWKTIFRANLILENVPQVEDVNFTDQERNAILGQAYFLRGFQYFYLVTMFRNVPLVTSPPKGLDEVLVAPAAPALVWELIISDFKMAQTLLPVEWDAGNLGKATSGAATGLLGKTYLYRAGIENNASDFALAAAEFKKIIDSGGYGLMADYDDNFTATIENNNESLFEIQHDSDANGSGWGADNPSTLRSAAWEPDLAPRPFTSQGGVTVNQWALDLFLEEPTINGEIDPRAYSTFIWNYPGAKIYQEEFADAYATKLDIIVVRKYLDFDTPGKVQSDFGFTAGLGSPINWRILRYADVLLMYAEALNEAGGPTVGGLDAINQVRSRSNMAPIPNSVNQTDFRAAIRRERVLELSIEGARYYDLLRWGDIPERFVDNPEFRTNMGGIFYAPGKEYLPIPAGEINTNTRYTQNPGY